MAGRRGGEAGSMKKQSRVEKKEDDSSSSVWTAVAYAGAAAFAWAAMEMAFKPWLTAGRRAIRKSLDPDYDVDDELDHQSRMPPPPSSSPPLDLPLPHLTDPPAKVP